MSASLGSILPCDIDQSQWPSRHRQPVYRALSLEFILLVDGRRPGHLGFTTGPSAPIMASERGEPRRIATGVNDYHLLPIFLISLIVLLSATELGRWLGTRVPDQGAEEVLTLQGAVLGLLALMIAFTFAMA